MIAALRILLALGFGCAAWFALVYVFRRRPRDLRRALAAFAITAVAALVFFAGMAIERLVSG
jgi:hypothetical protein